MQGTGWNDDLRAAGGLAGEVAVDPDPVHLAPLRDLDLADDRHVVLALAGGHARVAADAGVQVDRHPPLVALIVGMLLPEREVLRFLLEDAERGHASRFLCLGSVRTRSSVSVDSRTRGRPSMLPWFCVVDSGYVRAEPGHFDAAVEARGLGASDRERVEPDARADPPRVRTAIAERQGDHAVRHAGEDPDRKLERAARVLDTDHLLARNTERLGGLRAHERGVVPRELGERIGKLLQPSVVREAAVVKRRGGEEHDLQIA